MSHTDAESWGEFTIEAPTPPADKYMPIDEFTGVITGNTYTVYIPINQTKKAGRKADRKAEAELKDFKL